MRERDMRNKISFALLAGCLLMGGTGCTSILSPIEGVPVRMVPPEILAPPRANYIPLRLNRLKMGTPDEYLLAPDDILGVYIEGILPPKNEDAQIAEAPPVNFPEENSDLPPSVGYPIPVREDGTIALPLVEPIEAEGRTLIEVQELVRKAYTIDKEILKEDSDRILVSLMRERTNRIIVIREDAADDPELQRFRDSDVVERGQRGTGYVLDLPAYKNDLMHALAQTGGLPGLAAKNEIRILRGGEYPEGEQDEDFYQRFGVDPYTGQPNFESEDMVVIPLRNPPGFQPRLNKEDIILNDGDIVYIEARQTEFFYTGGLLPGGRYPLPRDYDLDVLGAMAIAGQGAGSGISSGGGGVAGLVGGGISGATPSLLYVIRKLPNGNEITIEVDLNDAINKPSSRILVAPGDTLILRYKPCEELVNFSLIGAFTFGIRQLVR